MNEPAGAIVVIVLAAGGSSRLGAPKQLVTFAGTSLLRHAATAALQAQLGPVLVVLGADQESMQQQLAGLAVHQHVHEQWSDGMGSSIAAGTDEVLQRWPDCRAIIVMACDQPAVSARHLIGLAEHYLSKGATCVASSYADTIGTPALFDTSHASRLLELAGDRGAKHLIEALGAATLPLAHGEVDVDGPDDLDALPGLDPR